jgi:UDP-glucose 4-epimerase
MRVVISGANGHLGQSVVRLLLEQGYEVLAVDCVEPRDVYRRMQEGTFGDLSTAARRERAAGLRYRQVDLSDLGQVYGALAGADAVIHLGAIASPSSHPPEVVFRNNVLGQFNVFEAAATLGIRRVVSASSVSALGFPWQHRWSDPLYFPIDEAHPLIPQDAYGVSKSVGEEIAAAYCRRGAGSAASLRFSSIISEDAYPAFVAHVRRDPGVDAHLLWSYVDVRDATRACLLSINASFEGHAPMFITSADTSADLPTKTLLERYFPNVPMREGVTQSAIQAERWALVDSTKASEVLDYRPDYSWPDVLAARADTAAGTA